MRLERNGKRLLGLKMVKTTYLNINRRAYLLRRTPFITPELSVARLRDPQACASLYAEVGAAHFWNIYRVCWDATAWQHYLAQPDIEVFQIHMGGTVIGYLEMKHAGEAIEIVNFGLLPAVLGRGLGRVALEAALAHGFSSGVNEICLHTCSLDHPAALSNYYARGFQFIKEVGDNFLPLDPLPAVVKLAA